MLPDDELWRAHLDAKQALIEKVRNEYGLELDPELPLIGYARRMTTYKRPELFFTDPGRLSSINGRHPFQAVFAGKAHPQDAGGRWVVLMKGAIARNASLFHSHRMMRRYAAEAYLR